ncbi:hypothetical protein Misp01_32870 [Microtetraspora sp. NBRC 13810]|uniref:YbaB/EbfC family nucleoid-associated protein n=1 Tax=Microtetraspora sp. NBRC 13810 TaxID=3030990 RepID=UPI0024A17F3F|nr:YbaB/EbfC family nucleoid-associated protein [Microtetraspora sp. NBRC 13810]GLW08157.1 hypothetical protein Misp01_32870 [Microtetraspora sp. NBRC 13810]
MFAAGSGDFRLGDLDRVVEQAEQARLRLEVMRSEFEGINGEGESANGRIRARSDAEGRILEVVVAPGAMELGSRDLGEEITLAVRRAQDDSALRREQVMREAAGQSPRTPEEIVEQLGEIAHRFNRAMDEQEARLDLILRDMGER